MKGVIAEQEKSLEEKESKIREDEGVRRKLHNTIQELKVPYLKIYFGHVGEGG